MTSQGENVQTRACWGDIWHWHQTDRAFSGSLSLSVQTSVLICGGRGGHCCFLGCVWDLQSLFIHQELRTIRHWGKHLRMKIEFTDVIYKMRSFISVYFILSTALFLNSLHVFDLCCFFPVSSAWSCSILNECFYHFVIVDKELRFVGLETESSMNCSGATIWSHHKLTGPTPVLKTEHFWDVLLRDVWNLQWEGALEYLTVLIRTYRTILKLIFTFKLRENMMWTFAKSMKQFFFHHNQYFLIICINNQIN